MSWFQRFGAFLITIYLGIIFGLGNGFQGGLFGGALGDLFGGIPFL